jgi:hypothetical protein
MRVCLDGEEKEEGEEGEEEGVEAGPASARALESRCRRPRLDGEEEEEVVGIGVALLLLLLLLLLLMLLLLGWVCAVTAIKRSAAFSTSFALTNSTTN